MKDLWKKSFRDYRPLQANGTLARSDERLMPVRSVSLSSRQRLIAWLDRQDDSRAAEEYRTIRTRLMQYAKHKQVILVASAWPGDGKTTNAINVAGMIALKAGETVLLLDGDMRRSNVSRSLGIGPEPGLSDVLECSCPLEEAVVRVEGLPNLHVLPAGSARSNPAELLNSEEWPALCADVRSKYRWIVVDSPPVASVSDYELLERGCDGIVMIVRTDHTKRSACVRANELVDREKLIGVIVNCTRDWFGYKTDDYSYYYRSSK